MPSSLINTANPASLSSGFDPASGCLLSICLEQELALIGLLRTDTGGAQLEDIAANPENSRDGQHLIAHIADLLEAGAVSLDEIRAIAFSAGPGGFTRVRVACAVAQGLALGRGIGLIPIDTMQARALAIRRTIEADESSALPADADIDVVILVDARMGEAFVGHYRVRAAGAWAAGGSPVQPLSPPVLVGLAALPQWLTAALADQRGGQRRVLLAAEPGLLDEPACAALVTAQPPWFEHVPVPAGVTTVRAIHELARSVPVVPAAQAAPIYLRDKIALNIDEQAALRAAGHRKGAG